MLLVSDESLTSFGNNNNISSNVVALEALEHYHQDLTTLTPLNASSTWTRNELIKNIFVLTMLSLVDLTTLVGNLLVVIAVITTKTLHTVTNSFIVSLACADMLVAILVMPFSIYAVIYNNWDFGSIACDLWISCDVMLCTASILNLCCISLVKSFFFFFKNK